MVFDVDMETKTLTSITPVDWERTKFDTNKFAAERAKMGLDSK